MAETKGIASTRLVPNVKFVVPQLKACLSDSISCGFAEPQTHKRIWNNWLFPVSICFKLTAKVKVIQSDSKCIKVIESAPSVSIFNHFHHFNHSLSHRDGRLSLQSSLAQDSRSDCLAMSKSCQLVNRFIKQNNVDQHGTASLGAKQTFRELCWQFLNHKHHWRSGHQISFATRFGKAKLGTFRLTLFFSSISSTQPWRKSINHTDQRWSTLQIKTKMLSRWAD